MTQILEELKAKALHHMSESKKKQKSAGERGDRLMQSYYDGKQQNALQMIADIDGVLAGMNLAMKC